MTRYAIAFTREDVERLGDSMIWNLAMASREKALVQTPGLVLGVLYRRDEGEQVVFYSDVLREPHPYVRPMLPVADPLHLRRRLRLWLGRRLVLLGRTIISSSTRSP